jgi:threonylcarbamoyladenosine tRNA methylthiotransferase CDKAL1
LKESDELSYNLDSIKKVSAIEPINLTPELPRADDSLKFKEFSLAIHERKKVWIEAYGCSASKADSEMILGQLQSYGYKIATDEQESSINIVVTCSVKDATEHKMLYRINELANSKKPIVIAGCLPKADRKRVEDMFPSASIMGPHSIDRAVDIVNNSISGKKIVALEDSVSDKINIPKVRINPIISIVEIASGCMSQCTFCQTKLAKGQIRSYRVGDIVRQIRQDIVDGCKEIWLTSTDNGCYGKDIGSSLVQLLRSCCNEEGNYKIRVGMMNPLYVPPILDELTEVYAANDKIFKFLHIPVQSGSDTILRKMKRGHSVKIFRELVTAFRSKIPKITIETDVIIGFPSETDEDFERTLRLIGETEPDIVNSSKYSARPNTPAASLKQVNSEVVKERTQKLHSLIKKISKKRNSIWKGWEGELVIDHIDEKSIESRNYAYKPVVVKCAGLSPSSLASTRGCHLGAQIRARIINYSSNSLTGLLVEEQA